jgi:hypothetical protein
MATGDKGASLLATWGDVTVRVVAPSRRVYQPSSGLLNGCSTCDAYVIRPARGGDGAEQQRVAASREGARAVLASAVGTSDDWYRRASHVTIAPP